MHLDVLQNDCGMEKCFFFWVFCTLRHKIHQDKGRKTHSCQQVMHL
jgi:hypothetical protein